MHGKKLNLNVPKLGHTFKVGGRMGYEIVYQYGKFHIWSTVVDDYIAKNLPDEKAVKEWFKEHYKSRYMEPYRRGEGCFTRSLIEGKYVYTFSWRPCSEIKPPDEVIPPEEWIEKVSDMWYEDAKKAKEEKRGGVEIVFGCQLDEEGNPVCVWRGRKWILP